MDIFTIKNLTFTYPRQQREALRGLSFSLRRGQFVTLAGPSGCGKTTLLRQLKTVLAPHGTRSGEILFEGTPLDTVGQRRQSMGIGFVQQSPENQIVTDKVWHELAFGLESLGCDSPTIRGRVAEMASFFGIQAWFHKSVHELSGGQKQLLSLASVMVMQPSVLILDEPTCQLDPISASEFLAAVGRINRELGTTVIMTEHRLEDVLPLSDRVLVMDQGRLIADGPPRQVGLGLQDAGHAMFLAMPTPMQVWAAVSGRGDCPVTVRDGRSWLADFAESHPLVLQPEPEPPPPAGDAVITLDDVWFKYEKNLPYVMRQLSLTVRKGELFALLGGNGTGKTTVLSLIAGLGKAVRGELSVNGNVGLLPQNPQALFVKKTLREDLYELFTDGGLPRGEQDEKIAWAVRLCRLGPLLDRHPYDLSGGEQQRAALAKTLLSDPEILLLDEPTKGLDAEFKQAFASVLQTLQSRGVTVFMVSHDVEFCAQYANRCALLFDGCVITEGTARSFFSGNSFYTTSANRMARSLLPRAVTAADVIASCGGRASPGPKPEEDTPPSPSPPEKTAEGLGLPWWRKLGAALSGIAALTLFVYFMRTTSLNSFVDAGGLTPLAPGRLLPYGVLILALFSFGAFVSRRPRRTDNAARLPKKKRGLKKRTLAASAAILLLIPLTLFVGICYFQGRRYHFIALLVLLEAMLPFFLIFEGRGPRARELAVIAALCALGVAGRAAFFILPHFKPVIALVIVTGVALGGETGFLVGAMTMLASNMMFSQGPWTPWQMFAMGIIGFLAGALFHKGWLGRGKGVLCVFGALSAILIYGGIMNPAMALMWVSDFNWRILLGYYITGFPMDCVQAAATAFFLWFGAQPMLEKLDRVKAKYGLAE